VYKKRAAFLKDSSKWFRWGYQ